LCVIYSDFDFQKPEFINKKGHMKIAIVLNSSWNIYNFRMSLISSLQEMGHEVHAIAPHDKYTPFLTSKGCIHHHVEMDSCGVNPIKDLQLMARLWRVYRKVQPDILFHYTIKPNIYGTLAAASLKIPVVNNVCGLGTSFLSKNFLARISSLLYQLSFRFAQKVFFHNPDDLRFFLDKRIVTEEIADILPGSGIELGKFQPEAFKKNEVFTFLMIARLIVDKGIIEYVEAAKLMKSMGLNVRCQVLGAKDLHRTRGISDSQLDEWVKTGVIEYLGVTDDVRSCVNQADCVVLPSYREGASRALLEAASLAKPIVATNVPGCNTIVKHDVNGFLCKVKNSDDLAKKMSIMSQLPDELLKKFGENGRKIVEEKFSDQLVIRKYHEAMLELKKAPFKFSAQQPALTQADKIDINLSPTV
jgi:glycosyltransferase involved in cell wall biosynthesis